MKWKRIETMGESAQKIDLRRTTEHWRPKKRSECPPHPCPFVGCRYHLMIDLDKHNNIVFNSHDIRSMKYTCVFQFIKAIHAPRRVARGRSYTLKQIGKTLNLTRERIRQLEEGALKKLEKVERYRDL